MCVVRGILMQRYVLPGFVCVCLAQFGMAEEAPSLPFSDANDLPMVLSATRLQQSLFDAPAAVTVIDHQMIEQSGVREILELLRLVPGMVVGYESGSEAFVSHHGTSADLARRMQVLVDGRSIYQPLLASVDWIGLPLDIRDIERIEVIRGPNAASYGVNSFFAVVNIITRHPADVTGETVSYRRGENGIEDYHARIAKKVGAVDWQLSLAGKSDEGFTDNRWPTRVVDEFVDSKNVDAVYGRAVWAIDDNSSLEFSAGNAGMTAEQQYRESNASNPVFLQAPVADRDNRFISLALDTDLSAAHQIRVQASHSRFVRDEPWFTTLPPLLFHPDLVALYKENRACANGIMTGSSAACTPAQAVVLNSLLALWGNPTYATERLFQSGNFSKEARTELDVQDTWIISPRLRSVFGMSYDKAEVNSSTYLSGHASNEVWGLFAHVEWQFANEWLLNIGAGQEFDRDAGNFFSPRAALNWQFVDNQVLRLVYSEAVRTPDILETSADWGYAGIDVLNPGSGLGGTYFQTGQASTQSIDAPTEKISSSELGYYGRFDVVRVTLDIRVFHDRMHLPEHDIEFEGFNIRPLESFQMRGAETTLDWKPLPNQRLQLNYAHLDMTGSLTNDNTNFVPKHSGSVGWWQEYRQDWRMGTTYYFYNDLRNHTTKAQTQFYDRLDVKMSKAISLPGQQRLELSAVMQWRLSEDAELRRENGVDSRHRGWLGAEWRY